MAALDRAQFDLVETQLKYDFQVVDVYLKSLRSSSISQYQAKRGWRVRRHQATCEAVDKMLATRFHSINADEPAATVLRKIYECIGEVKQRHGNLPDDFVYTIVWTNWVSTSLIKSHEFHCHAHVLGGVVNMPNTENIGAVLMPAHSWKQNCSWQNEVEAMKMISNSGLVFAKSCVVAMSEYGDMRDDRPSGYQMRLVHSQAAPKEKVFGGHGAFRLAPAARKAFTDFAKPLPTKDMVRPEILGDDVLPDSTNAETHLNAAERWHQIGEAASTRALSAITTNLRAARGHVTVLFCFINI